MSKKEGKMDKVRRSYDTQTQPKPCWLCFKNNFVSSGNTIAQSDTDDKNDKDIIIESDIDDDEDEEEEEDIIAIFGTETDDEQSSDDDECDEEMFWEQSNKLIEKRTRSGRVVRSRDATGESFTHWVCIFLSFVFFAGGYHSFSEYQTRKMFPL